MLNYIEKHFVVTRFLQIMRIDEIADIQMGYPFRSRLEPDPRGDVAVIQMKDIDDSNLLHADKAIKVALPPSKSRHFLRPGDLLFRSRGRSNGAALVPTSIALAVLSAPMLLVRPHSVLPEYLCWFINTPTTQAQLAMLAEGTSVQMISAESLKSLDIPLPSKGVQQRIARVATLMEHEQELLTQIAEQRRRLTTYMLMHQALQTEGKTVS